MWHEIAGMRLAETMLLQVEQGLLPPDALDRLGYGILHRYLSFPIYACIWPDIVSGVSTPLVIGSLRRNL